MSDSQDDFHDDDFDLDHNDGPLTAEAVKEAAMDEANFDNSSTEIDISKTIDGLINGDEEHTAGNLIDAESLDPNLVDYLNKMKVSIDSFSKELGDFSKTLGGLLDLYKETHSDE